ncbi:MAG: ABC transporter ATP-binding protein [Spirochaetales bacterium]|nr:ABC transporter ATP-binding protein [Spirochaetales bacterium]
MERIIEAKGLTKHYGDVTAVRDVGFYVNKGEIFGFLGPNGAGKTTTINMLIGMAKINGGKIYYKNEDLTKNIKKAQNIIGVIADESNLYNEMSGYENLCFCGSLYGLPKPVRSRKARELLAAFQLTEASHKKFGAYSKGMKRKLTIAAALIHEPEIIFMDEPTTGIDVASVRQIRGLIKRLNEAGTTIFLTTHYIEEAERLCDRVAFIHRGSIIRIDTVGRLIEDAREANVIEVVFEQGYTDRPLLPEQLMREFPDVECSLKNDDTVKVTGRDTIDITPIVCFLSGRGVRIREARLIRPTLEDAFVKLTGIEIAMMKKEKEKK